MKTDYIYDMPAGKEMDTLVAEKVMKLCVHDWKLTPNDDDGVCRICQKCHLEFWGLRPPIYGCHYGSYSTDIAAAWEVVEKIAHNASNELARKQGFSYWQLNAYPDKGWACRIGSISINADTAPLAICRVALLAIEYEPE